MKAERHAEKLDSVKGERKTFAGGGGGLFDRRFNKPPIKTIKVWEGTLGDAMEGKGMIGKELAGYEGKQIQGKKRKERNCKGGMKGNYMTGMCVKQ